MNGSRRPRPWRSDAREATSRERRPARSGAVGTAAAIPPCAPDAASTDADPILHPDETPKHGKYVTLCYELHHVILPELEAEAVVEFDRRDGEVTRGATFEEISVIGRTDGERGPIRRRPGDDE